MVTRARSFDDTVFPASVMRGLIFDRVWNGGEIGYHLAYSDHDGNGRNDWSEDGARQAMERVFELWSDVADLDFFATSESQATLIERISDAGDDGEGEGITLGFHYLPGGNSGAYRSGEQSDGEYNHDAPGWDAGGLRQGGSAFATMIHEIGHALGLEHPFDDDLFTGLTGAPFGEFGSFGLNQGAYTVMTYNRGLDANGGRSPSHDYGRSGTPLALDIAAVQAVYGANTTHALGDDTYTLSDVNGAGTFYASIWDAGGNDTIAYDGAKDASVFLDEATIDDTPRGGGLVSYIEGVYGGLTVARGAVIENARTGSGDDVIGGNAGGNVIEAGAGDDYVMGLGGDDTIFGGDGDDVIGGDYVSVAEFGIALTPEPAPYTGPELPDGLGRGSGEVPSFATDPKNSLITYRDISGSFALRSEGDIEQGERLWSVTVDAQTGGGVDHYRIVLGEDARLTLDVDGAWSRFEDFRFDAFLEVVDAQGRTVAQNDDGPFVDAGSTEFQSSGRTLDSFLDVTLEAGTYFVRIGEYTNDNGGSAPGSTDPGFSYDLHVVADAYVVDLPDLPGAGPEQFGYYYETPDFSDAIGGYDRSRDEGSSSQGGHWHVLEDGSRVWHATGHGDACGCCGCLAEKGEAPEDGEVAGGTLRTPEFAMPGEVWTDGVAALVDPEGFGSLV